MTEHNETLIKYIYIYQIKNYRGAQLSTRAYLNLRNKITAIKNEFKLLYKTVGGFGIDTRM